MKESCRGGIRGCGSSRVPAVEEQYLRRRCELAAEEQYRGGGAETSPTRIGREEETGVEIEQC
jgi:hypothetical protein